MMLLRANVIATGYTGARPALAELLLAMLNARLHPPIPEQGSVGASGDLAPLAHLALSMIGEGELIHNGRTGAAAAILREHGLQPAVLGPKEGIVLINGTQAMLAIGCLELQEAERLADTADVICAMRPSVAAMAVGTRSGSRTGDRSTNQVPSVNAVSACPATSMARRVLPAPAAPIRLSRRTSACSKRSRMRATSGSRPTSGPGWAGRLPAARRAGAMRVAGPRADWVRSPRRPRSRRRPAGRAPRGGRH